MRASALTALFGALVLSSPAQAQAPGPAPVEPSLAAHAPPARLGAEVDRVGVWGEGPSYAVATDADGRSAWGSGRILRAAVPGGADTVAVQLPGVIRDVALEWPFAFVGTEHFGDDDARGLEIVNLAVSAVVGRVPGSYIYGLHADDRLVTIVAFDGAWALRTIDASDPTAPVELGRVPLNGFLRGVDVRDGVAYVGAGTPGVHVVDVSDPAAPAFVRTVAVPGYARWLDADAGGLAVAFGVYTAGGGGGVQFFSLDDPADPQPGATWNTGDVVEDVAWVSGTQVAAAASYAGVFGVTADGFGSGPVSTFTANLVPGANRLAVLPDGDVLSADYYYGGFRVDLLAESFEPAWTGRNFVLDIEQDGAAPQTLYAAAGAYGVARLEARPDGALVETGRAHDATFNYVRDVAEGPGHLYAAGGFSGIHVVDKATLVPVAVFAPGFVDRIAYDELTDTIVASGGTTVTLARWNGSTVDVLQSFSGSQRSGLVAYQGAAYLGNGDIQNIDILRLGSNPAFVGFRQLGDGYPGPNIALDRVNGRLAGEAANNTPVYLFDLGQPLSPASDGTVGPLDVTAALALRGDLLATTGTQSAFVYDTETSAPLGSRSDLFRTPSALALTNTELYVGVAQGGVEWLRSGRVVASESGPSDGLRLVAAPNPTTGPVRITLGSDDEALVEVWTVTGRRVRELDAPLGAGTVDWDGRDDRGQRVASGVYLVRVTAGDTVETVPVTVLR